MRTHNICSHAESQGASNENPQYLVCFRAEIRKIQIHFFNRNLSRAMPFYNSSDYKGLYPCCCHLTETILLNNYSTRFRGKIKKKVNL